MSESANLPSNWITASITDIADIEMGQSPPSSSYCGSAIGLPFFQGKAEFGKLYPTAKVWCSKPTKIAEQDSILLSVRAPVGPTNLAPEKCCIGRGLAAIKPVSGVNLRYVLNALRRYASELDALGTGTTFKAVSGKVVRKFALPLAPPPEQERIADTLDELLSDLDAGVAALERVQKKLTHYRAAVLKAAVEGDLTADWRAQHPDTEPASALLPRILTERRRRWEEDQLRKLQEAGKEPPKNWKAKYRIPPTPKSTEVVKLPKTWICTCLGQLFAVHVGATPSREKKAYWNGTIPWVASGEVQFCRIRTTRERISEEGLAASSTRLNPVGSVILNMIGEGKTRGKVGILEIEACNNQNCAAIWVSETPVLPEFVYFWLLYQYEQTRQLGSGNNQSAMNKAIVEQIKIPLPPLAEQEAIVEAVEAQLSVIDHLEADIAAKLKSAQGLRQSILRHAFTGQLVPQDPNDEPASELLKRIATERAERALMAASARLATKAARKQAKPAAKKAANKRANSLA